MENLKDVADRVKLIRGDLADAAFAMDSIRDTDVVFHLAANGSIRKSSEDPMFDFRSNVVATVNVLEAMRRNDIPRILFTSSSAVYGRPEKTPVSEDDMTVPVSNYGRSKLCAENYIRGFSEFYGIKGVVLRYANIIGPGCVRGIIPDFVEKLSNNPNSLEILGDGNQMRSYLDIRDCIGATLAASNSAKTYDVYTVGSERWTSVDEIAKMVTNAMGLEHVKLEHTGGKIGWKGDVDRILMDVYKIKKLGWKSEIGVEESVVRTVDWLMKR